MSEINKNNWLSTLIKVVIAALTTLAGALGVSTFC